MFFNKFETEEDRKIFEKVKSCILNCDYLSVNEFASFRNCTVEKNDLVIKIDPKEVSINRNLWNCDQNITKKLLDIAYNEYRKIKKKEEKKIKEELLNDLNTVVPSSLKGALSHTPTSLEGALSKVEK